MKKNNKTNAQRKKIEATKRAKERRQHLVAAETSEKDKNKYKACIHQWAETTPHGLGVASISHYEFSFQELVSIMKWKPVALSKCHQSGSSPYSADYKTDYECVAAALMAFVPRPYEDTMAMFLDADPNKSDQQIEAEWRRGVKTSGDLIECVNHAVARPERREWAYD